MLFRSECLIRLLPSLQFALDEEEFARFAAITQNRMAETNSDSDTNDAEEEDGADADE